MKTLIKKTVAALLLVNSYKVSKAQTTEELPADKFSLGIGGTYHTDGIGGTIKFDIRKNQKLSFGTRIHAGTNKWRDYTWPADNPSGSGAPGWDAHFHTGHIINGFLTSTYYILGNNSSSKAGLYLSAGLGYQDWTMSETVVYTDNMYDHDDEFSYRTFSGLICAGGDYKLGAGKIFMDIPFVIDFYERYDNRMVYKSGLISNTSSKGFSYFAGGFLAVNGGYAFNF